ncbi:MAG TPA: catalase family peroxidase [Bryobacteraceae bacterium]|jgi:catalase
MNKTILIALICGSALTGASSLDLAQQIAALMSQSPSGKAGMRFTHPKGIVCEGIFEASREAASVSRAAHFREGTVPVTVRFSDGAPDIHIPDNSPDAGPQGMAIRFMTGDGVDIVAMSHNGFVVGTGEEFLSLLQAVSATDPSRPHPWPVEGFLGTHPRALKYVQDNHAVPAGFDQEAFFGNNAFRFVNSNEKVQSGRYQIMPVSGTEFLDEATAKSKSPDFLREGLRSRLGEGPVRYRLFLQLAGPTDRTDDSSLVWPADRQTVELGVITIKSIVPDSVAAERMLAFDPLHLTDGIENSDDPLPELRSFVYAISAGSRRKP